jgi:hypothetical protein
VHGTAGNYKNAKAKKVAPPGRRHGCKSIFYAGQAACSGQTELDRCSGCGCPRPGGLRGSALEGHNKLASEDSLRRGQRLGMQTTDALLPQRHPIEEARIPGPKGKPAFHLRPLGPPKRASDAPLRDSCSTCWRNRPLAPHSRDPFGRPNTYCTSDIPQPNSEVIRDPGPTKKGIRCPLCDSCPTCRHNQTLARNSRDPFAQPNTYCTSEMPQRHSEVIATPPRSWGRVGRSIAREQGWPTRALSLRAPRSLIDLGG